jgi:hypothetical protein
MNSREAKPGKPGHWNGRKQRWRAYKRAFRHMDPGAASRIADKEIKWKARLVRLETIRRSMRIVALAVAIGGVLFTLATLQCAVHRGAVTVEKATP